MAVFVDMEAIQFENANELRNYPFTDGSSMTDREGKTLPLDVVADVGLTVPACFDAPADEDGIVYVSLPVVRLSSVHLSPSMVSICFTSELNGAKNALSVTVSGSSFAPYTPYRLHSLVGSNGIGGIVTFGDIEFPGYPETYFLDNLEVHPCCVVPSKPMGLRSIEDPRSGERLSGDVDIGFSGYVKANRDGKTFSLSLEENADAELASECAEAYGAEACGATPISSINGVRPDSDGNIVLWFH